MECKHNHNYMEISHLDLDSSMALTDMDTIHTMEDMGDMEASAEAILECSHPLLRVRRYSLVPHTAEDTVIFMGYRWEAGAVNMLVNSAVHSPRLAMGLVHR